MAPGPRARWQEKLASLTSSRSRDAQAERSLTIGLCWQGNPGLGHDWQRSVRLQQFAPVAALRGIQLFSVQKGPGAEQLADSSFSIIDLGSRFEDFTDTAAALVSLDLIISVDTSVAHLAGALGVPVWVWCLGFGLALAAGTRRLALVPKHASVPPVPPE